MTETISRIVEKNQDSHHIGVRHLAVSMVLAFIGGFSSSYRVLLNDTVKKILLKSLHIENISIILSLGNIAVVFIVFLARQNY